MLNLGCTGGDDFTMENLNASHVITTFLWTAPCSFDSNIGPTAVKLHLRFPAPDDTVDPPYTKRVIIDDILSSSACGVSSGSARRGHIPLFVRFQGTGYFVVAA